MIFSAVDKLEIICEVKLMERNEILEKVAPCTLMCHTCSAYCNGIICESSKTL